MPPSKATDLAYTPDRRCLIALSLEGRRSFYALEVDEIVEVLRDRLTRSWTEAESRQYRIEFGYTTDGSSTGAE